MLKVWCTRTFIKGGIGLSSGLVSYSHGILVYSIRLSEVKSGCHKVVMRCEIIRKFI